MASKLKVGSVLLHAGSTTNACMGAIGMEDEGGAGSDAHQIGSGGSEGPGGSTGSGGSTGTGGYTGSGGYVGTDDEYMGTGGTVDVLGGAPNGEGGLGGDGAD